ncbi:MAG: pyrroline-5-carboxylate reductase [Clostridia bacterium]|nr:pyrroline-5-carboxylate reductase [Clostridia bacterium]
MPKYGFIGGGRMASAMIGALLSAGQAPSEIAVSDKNSEILLSHKKLGIAVFENNADVASSEYVFLAVKPQHLNSVLDELEGKVYGKTVVSIVAGVKTERIAAKLKGASAVVRVMPNTPLLVGKGAVAIAFGNAAETVKEEITALFSARGEVVEVREELLDAVTALSGSGPAYFYRIADVLARCASAHGLDYGTALRLSVATMAGAAEMMSASGKSPSELISDVSSPGGTTIAALAAFDSAELNAALEAGVDAALKRSEELSRG